MAALRTAEAASEEVSGTARGIGQRSVNTLEKPRFADLDELGVARWKRHRTKDNPTKCVALDGFEVSHPA
jgi:hypothetical protein